MCTIVDVFKCLWRQPIDPAVEGIMLKQVVAVEIAADGAKAPPSLVCSDPTITGASVRNFGHFAYRVDDIYDGWRRRHQSSATRRPHGARALGRWHFD
jgi:hypothetical protein